MKKNDVLKLSGNRSLEVLDLFHDNGYTYIYGELKEWDERTPAMARALKEGRRMTVTVLKDHSLRRRVAAVFHSRLSCSGKLYGTAALRKMMDR